MESGSRPHQSGLKHPIATSVPVSPRQALWLLAGITLLGACLRLVNLGELGFRWDEDLSGLTVQGILEHGVPQLPSGLLYLRGIGMSYLMAASAAILGFTELALRLPAALFSIATIPLSFIFLRKLLSNGPALIVAALFALSFWDIEMGRYARMYAPFTFFYLLTLYCIWRFRIETPRLWGGLLAVVCALAAVSLHRLGYTLAFAFFIPTLLRLDKGLPAVRELLFPVGAFTMVGYFFWYWKEVINDNYARFSLPLWEGLEEGADLYEPEASEDVFSLGPLGNEVALPDVELVANLWARLPSLYVLIAAAALTGFGFLLWRYRERHDGLQRLLLVVMAISCAVAQYNLALLALIALVFSRRQGIAVLRDSDVLLAVLAMALGFVLWFGLALGLDLGGHASEGAAVAVRRTIKGLLNYPQFYIFWGFAKEWPVLSLVALVGGLYALDRAAQRPLDESAFFLLLAFGLPLTLNGLLRIPFEMFRYNVPLDPLFYSFVALGLLGWREVARQLGLDTRGRAPALITGVLVAAILLTDLNPIRSALVTVRGYEQTALGRVLSVPPFPDFKSPARFVRERAAPEDLVFVLDSREVYNYLGRADYWIYSERWEVQTYQSGDTIRDKFVDTPLIRDLNSLQEKLEQPGPRKWLIASDRMLARTSAISPEIKDFIAALDDKVAFTGDDRATKVYLFN